VNEYGVDSSARRGAKTAAVGIGRLTSRHRNATDRLLGDTGPAAQHKEVGPRSRRETRRFPHYWALWLSEGLGTALLVAVGCSLVVIDFGVGSPIVHALPSATLRRVLTGFFFGSVGGSIALSPVGKVSGAHINPVVTLAFWLRRTLRGRLAAGYVVAQCLGAMVGAAALRLWGPLGASIHYAATTPGAAGPLAAFLGETGATACLILGLFVMLGHRPLRRFTPALFPFLYALLVGVEAPLSGTSTNPARTLGPALIAGVWSGWWIYWIAPAAGTLLALAMLGVAAPITRWRVDIAKLYHFEHDPHGLLHRLEVRNR
jgi:aquaporin Z